jgi:hypothetical protein
VRLSFKKAKKNMTLLGVTEQRLAINFVFAYTPKNKTKTKTKQKSVFFLHIRRSRKYIICELYILDKRYKGFLKGRNLELDDRRLGRRRIMVITSWFSLQYG